MMNTVVLALLSLAVLGLGPAPRSLDRFAHTVAGGVLTVDTGHINLGPLPIALGQGPGSGSRGQTSTSRRSMRVSGSSSTSSAA